MPHNASHSEQLLFDRILNGDITPEAGLQEYYQIYPDMESVGGGFGSASFRRAFDTYKAAQTAELSVGTTLPITGQDADPDADDTPFTARQETIAIYEQYDADLIATNTHDGRRVAFNKAMAEFQNLKPNMSGDQLQDAFQIGYELWNQEKVINDPSLLQDTSVWSDPRLKAHLATDNTDFSNLIQAEIDSRAGLADGTGADDTTTPTWEEQVIANPSMLSGVTDEALEDYAVNAGNQDFVGVVQAEIDRRAEEAVVASGAGGTGGAPEDSTIYDEPIAADTSFLGPPPEELSFPGLRGQYLRDLNQRGLSPFAQRLMGRRADPLITAYQFAEPFGGEGGFLPFATGGGQGQPFREELSRLAGLASPDVFGQAQGLGETLEDRDVLMGLGFGGGRGTVTSDLGLAQQLQGGDFAKMAASQAVGMGRNPLFTSGIQSFIRNLANLYPTEGSPEGTTPFLQRLANLGIFQ